LSKKLNFILRHRGDDGEQVKIDQGGWADIRAVAVACKTTVSKIANVALAWITEYGMPRFELAVCAWPPRQSQRQAAHPN
jgi:RNA:NAD 2'-phosphotransferase (TPT1/KptA family)